jgi:hypothetical protein
MSLRDFRISGFKFNSENFIINPPLLAEKIYFLRLIKNAQMQGTPAFAEAATRRQAKS